MHKNGDFYIGHFDKDKKSGQGKLFSLGNVYEGYFEEGLY
jgi:hypothetical protein